jgi:peptidoglycan/LPS O-acetylase OafA/YrhL
VTSVSGTTDFKYHRFQVLDGMRGVAAILIMLYHYYRACNYTFLSNTFIAVDFFFILSGFVISYSYGQKLLNGMSASNYILRRIGRLFPMMLIGIIIGAVSFYFPVDPSDFSHREIIASVTLNLFFIPYLNHKITFSAATGNIFPVDPPLWSIFFELTVSVLFIGLIRLGSQTLEKLGILSYAFLCAACLIGGLIGYNNNIGDPGGFEADNFLSGFPRVFYGFICGMLLYRLRGTPSRYRLLNWLQHLPSLSPIWLYGALALMLACPVKLCGFYYLIAIVFCAPFLVMHGGKARCHNSMILFLSENLGWLSYPIYCLHMPVLFGIRVLAVHHILTNYLGLPIEMLAIAVTLILATLSAVIVDKYVQKRFIGMLQYLFNGYRCG